MAADTDSEHVVSHSWTALGVGNEMVEVEPDFVRAAGSGTAPAIPPQNFSLLSLRGIAVTRIEADSLVLDGRESIF